MIRYLSGVSTPALKAVSFERNIGLLCQPGNSYTRQVKAFPFWAADNGCFSQGDAFDLEAYLEWLRANQDLASSCLFATAPDVVGDMLRTWARSIDVLERIRALGFPAALVAQNGLRYDHATDSLQICRDDRDPSTWTGIVPWESFDVLFIGGDDRFKLSLVRQHSLIAAAKAHAKHVHVGRVNSYTRLQQCEWFGADTADGTFLAFAGRSAAGQEAAVQRLTSWLDELWSFHPVEVER